MKLNLIALNLAGACVAPALVSAAYVMPMIGGGQVGMMGAPMIHTDVGFNGSSIGLVQDTSHGVPVLRALTPPDSFDPAQPWAVLQHKHYNFQHAWNPMGFITLPTDGGIWVERLSHTPGLETFQRPPAAPAYLPIFQNDGDRWKWSGGMTHNAYAVLNPALTEYFATYKVYIGDAVTGAPMPGYGSATVTWQLNVIPEPSTLAALASASLLLLRRRG